MAFLILTKKNRMLATRRFKKGMKPEQLALLKKLLKRKKECKEIDGVMQKPQTVRTHLRTMVIVPEMVGSVVGVYTGKHYTTVEIKVIGTLFLREILRLT